MAETMKAAVLHAREDLRMERVPVPTAGPGELVLRVDAALTCGTDLKVFRRGYHAKMLTLNRLFGHELAGTVVEVGEGVTSFALGDRVVPLNSAPCDDCFFCRQGQQNLCDDLLFNNGAYAEFIGIPARIVEKNTLKLPAAMPFEHAALTEPLACVMRGLEESQAKAGQTVIVLGAGPIGLLFIHAASLAGLYVIAVVKRSDQVDTAKRFGAEQVLRIGDVADPIAAARALTPEGRGADIVIEAVATPEAWQWAAQMARKGGLINLFGGPPAGTTVQFDTNLLHYSDLTLKASFHHTPSTARAAFDLLCSGRFQCQDFLTGTATLDEVPEVFTRMLVRPAEGIVPEIKTAIFPGRPANELHPAFAAAEKVSA
ncbi:zinc-binding dehydrogenase [Granulicella mallensis]|jgi:L-iditol 2-dehydrogenase|uniref:L-iditol 2-dehydrogenase n=1 Tax=Granulicella mallensis TaxID=940614 RepID=A0A7W8E872_9BACT|nr:zinc-binding dehydrogenase [Granulicella mallensis]MBB5062537.1 L-iditol 2-dehydrogenase [Granulicella mallensis]